MSGRQWTFPIASTIDYRYFPALKSDSTGVSCTCRPFMGTNAISITLSNAVFLGTPSILLNNFKVLDFQRISSILPKMPSWYQDVTKHVSSVFGFRCFLGMVQISFICVLQIILIRDLSNSTGYGTIKM